MDEATGVFLHVAGIDEPVKAEKRYCSETVYVGSSPVVLETPNGTVASAECEGKHKRAVKGSGSRKCFVKQVCGES
jgi:hypothetical protein